MAKECWLRWSVAISFFFFSFFHRLLPLARSRKFHWIHILLTASRFVLWKWNGTSTTTKTTKTLPSGSHFMLVPVRFYAKLTYVRRITVQLTRLLFPSFVSCYLFIWIYFADDEKIANYFTFESKCVCGLKLLRSNTVWDLCIYRIDDEVSFRTRHLHEFYMNNLWMAAAALTSGGRNPTNFDSPSPLLSSRPMWIIWCNCKC